MTVENDNQLIDDAKMQTLRSELSPTVKNMLAEFMRTTTLDYIDQDKEALLHMINNFESVLMLLGMKSDNVTINRDEFERRKDNNDL